MQTGCFQNRISSIIQFNGDKEYLTDVSLLQDGIKAYEYK